MFFDFTQCYHLSTGNKSVFSCAPIQFSFVGPRGVGKSSLMASMYQQIKEKKITIAPSGYYTENILNGVLADMKEMISETQMGAVVADQIGIIGTENARKYQFCGKQIVVDRDLLSTSFFKEFHFYFNFQDIPGGWYLPQSKQFNKSIRKLMESTVSYIAVDTPALMESDATCNRFNMSDIIRDWYKGNIPILAARKHAVIFVLSRCEKFWNDKESMVQKLKETYSTLIRDFNSAGVCVYVTWIKTLGGLEFYKYEKYVDSLGKRTKRACFKRVGNYEPENCATPLTLGLEICLNAAADDLKYQVENNLLKWFSASVGLSNEYLAINAARRLADRLRNDLNVNSAYTYTVF